MNTHEHDTALDFALHQWKLDAPLPLHFQDRVWQRITRAETLPETRLSPLDTIQRLLDVVLPRPKFAFAYLTAFLLLGVAGGSVLAQHKSSRLESELGLRYVQSLNPYAEIPRP